MDDKHLTGEQKRAQLKEEYKRELQLRKQMLEQARGAGLMNKINGTLAKMEAMLGTDDTDEWIARVGGPAAAAEARIDMALQTAGEAPAAAAPAPPVSATEGAAPGAKTLGEEARTDAPNPATPLPPPPTPGQARKTLGDEEL